jgi:hypothetical protein
MNNNLFLIVLKKIWNIKLIRGKIIEWLGYEDIYLKAKHVSFRGSFQFSSIKIVLLKCNDNL